jgi:hypothetical protein
MIVKMWDKTEVVVSREVAERLESELTKPADRQIKFVKLNGELFALSGVAAIRKGGVSESDVKRLPARTSMTDDDRLRNRERIANMRETFFARKAR